MNEAGGAAGTAPGPISDRTRPSRGPARRGTTAGWGGLSAVAGPDGGRVVDIPAAPWQAALRAVAVRLDLGSPSPASVSAGTVMAAVRSGLLRIPGAVTAPGRRVVVRFSYARFQAGKPCA
jgi:hypothetical protein